MKKSLTAVTFLVSLFLSVGIGEIAIRNFFPNFDPPQLLYLKRNADGLPFGTPNSQFRLWSNTKDFDTTVHFNEYGFRDQKVLEKARESDWFVVGDSFSFGFGVAENERYSNQLEHLMGSPVYNISSPGTQIRHYEKLVRYAERNGARIKKLIIGICMENDLLDYERFPDFIAPPDWKRDLKIWLAHRLAIYNAFAYVIHQHETLQQIAVMMGLVADHDRTIQKNFFNDRILATSVNQLDCFAKSYDSLIVIIPSRGLWIGRHQETERKVHETFVRLLTEKGIAVIDLRRAFEESGEPLGFHFKRDGHWNSKGHLRAAQVIAEYILQQGIKQR